MLIYSQTKIGDILRVVGDGAPGFAALGDLVRVKTVVRNGVTVENRNGEIADFLFNCGASRLEPTDYENEFYHVPQ